jgi:tRNA-binding protein
VSFPACAVFDTPPSDVQRGIVISKMNPLVMKPTADYSHFEALDIRVGRIIKVEDTATRKPTYRITIDFGPEIGVKVSCGAYRNYAPDELLGKQIIGVVNFAEKKMGPEVSQVLVLGVPDEKGETTYLMPQTDVLLGAKVF